MSICAPPEADFARWAAEHDAGGDGCALRDDGPHDGPLVTVTVVCKGGTGQSVPGCASCRDWVAHMPADQEIFIKGACCGGIMHTVRTVTEASGLVLYTRRR